VQLACRFIERNFGNPVLDKEMLCTALVTGMAYLEVLFEKELGIGIDEFISQVRINRSRFIAEKNPQLTAEEIARLAGYRDVKPFQQTFQQIAGVSFEEFRGGLNRLGNG
jgi:two-component system response regulator YesN